MRQCHKTLIPAFSGTLSSFDTCRKFREHSCSRLHLMWLLCFFRSLQTSFMHHNSMMYAEVWINCKWKCLHGKKLACPKGVHLTSNNRHSTCISTILLMPELTMWFLMQRVHFYLKRNEWSSYVWDSLLWRMALLQFNSLHVNRSLERLLSTNELLTLHSCSTLPVSSFPRWFSNNATSTFWYSNLFSLFIESVRHLCGFPTKSQHSSFTHMN